MSTEVETRQAIEMKLADWLYLRECIAGFKPTIDAEMALRKEIFASAFPTPKEVTNAYPLAAGWTLKATYKLDRKVKVELLASVREELAKIGVSVDPLLRYVPELETKNFKALSEQAKIVFSEMLEVKPASPSMELVPPNEAK